jgi:hypothetical protein
LSDLPADQAKQSIAQQVKSNPRIKFGKLYNPLLIRANLLKLRRNDMAVKKSYAQPKLTAYGNVEVLTQGASAGNQLDADFPTGTPFNDLTFS